MTGPADAAHAQADRIITPAEHQDSPGQLAVQMADAMRHGANDPAYAKAFSDRFTAQLTGDHNHDASLLNNLAIANAMDQAFNGKSLPNQGEVAPGVTVRPCGTPDNPVVAVYDQNNHSITYTDKAGKSQSFETMPPGETDPAKQFVRVTTDGKPQDYPPGSSVTMGGDNGLAPIIRQPGGATSTVDWNGFETTTLKDGSKVVREHVNGDVTSFNAADGTKYDRSAEGKWQVTRPGDKTPTPLDHMPDGQFNMPPGSKFSVSPDGKPVFEIPGANGTYRAEVEPTTGKAIKIGCPDGSTLEYHGSDQKWYRKTEHDGKPAWQQIQDPNDKGVFQQDGTNGTIHVNLHRMSSSGTSFDKNYMNLGTAA
jgi:hypothetical protein